MSNRAERAQAGFTLLELIITVALAAILLSLALPSLRAVVQNNRLTVQANDLQTAFQFARSEALKRSRPVSVCASDTSSADDADLECGADWTLGWIAYVDDEIEGTDATGIDEVLRRWPPLRGDATLNHDGDEDFVRYLADGSVDGITMPAPPLVFELRIPDCTGENARDISIVLTGRSHVERVEC
ncbi:GspH/FimT family pseudopilin [Wenzhouxiangella marina]|uniref:Type II secretion system protein H n=1 Tax=Wenzhouxiangella marina TaxID=1579979 RepID=A0A0K0XSM5_9GAMM|nr:GspH/FimT family pseudopilin [Wenzhouxiangella marina]AKS40631.1 hypothetical protein WM2015_242 [Wenzhouxiangella marina]MBB6088399.1 type IV fimbrial biogenesis protein FimT [Wenzhouxiangella marina]